jgi:hypothetical protein
MGYLFFFHLQNLQATEKERYELKCRASQLTRLQDKEEELLSLQNLLKERDASLAMKEAALAESQSNVTQAMVKMEVEKVVNDFVKHSVNAPLQDMMQKLFYGSGQDNGEDFIPKLVRTNVRVQEDNLCLKQENDGLRHELKRYKSEVKKSPQKKQNWQPLPQDIDMCLKKLHGLQYSYFDSQRYPVVLYELRSQGLQNDTHFSGELPGKTVCSGPKPSDVLLLTEVKERFVELSKSTDVLLPLWSFAEDKLGKGEDTCISAIVLYVKRMMLYRIHIVITSRILTHEDQHEDGVGYAMPQGYVAYAEAKVEKSELKISGYSADHCGNLEWTRTSKFGQPIAVHPFLQRIASYLDRRIVEHLEDCYNKYRIPMEILSIPSTDIKP